MEEAQQTATFISNDLFDLQTKYNVIEDKADGSKMCEEDRANMMKHIEVLKKYMEDIKEVDGYDNDHVKMLNDEIKRGEGSITEKASEFVSDLVSGIVGTENKQGEREGEGEGEGE